MDNFELHSKAVALQDTYNHNKLSRMYVQLQEEYILVAREVEELKQEVELIYSAIEEAGDVVSEVVSEIYEDLK